MKFVVQRVKNAQVDIEGKTVGKIEQGYMVLIGITHTDTKEVADYFGRNNYFVGKVENNIFKCDDFQLKCDKSEGLYEVMIRPSSITINENNKDFKIKNINYLGDYVEVILSKNEKEVIVKSSVDILNKDYFKLGNKVGIEIKKESISYFKYDKNELNVERG